MYRPRDRLKPIDKIPYYTKGNNGLLYFKYPTALSIIIISAKGSTSRKNAILAPVVIQAITVQKLSVIVKALNLYYKDRSKLDSFLISIDIYILFN
jgi:hypothetical protein